MAARHVIMPCGQFLAYLDWPTHTKGGFDLMNALPQTLCLRHLDRDEISAGAPMLQDRP